MVYRVGSISMVMERELDNEWFTAKLSQLVRTDHTVVAIEPHPPGQRCTNSQQDRSNRPSDDPESGVTLTDVVEKGGPNG